jgi:hypothetical protein
VSRRGHRKITPVMVAGGLIMLVIRVVYLAVLAVAFAGKVALILLVPRRTRSRYRQLHGREGARSADISPRQHRRVAAADRGRCVARRLGSCAGGPNSFFEDDHGVPWIAGGFTWLPNLFLTCHFHNQTKSNWNRDKDGYVHYRPSRWGGVNDPALAEAIRECERRAARNPLRYLRAVLAW